MDSIIFQNKWCKIVSRSTYYVLISKSGKYNDQYFAASEQALNSIGIQSQMKTVQKLPSSQEEVNQIHCNQFKKISHESE